MRHLPDTKLITLAALLALTGASASAHLTTDLELDSLYQNRQRGNSVSGKVALIGAVDLAHNYTLRGIAAVAIRPDGLAVAHDVWGQIGNAQWDVRLGRFEAYHLFPLVRDAYIANAGEGGYRANVLRGRVSNGAGQARAVFQGAVNYRWDSGLGLELSAIETGEAGLNKGLRPVLYYHQGPWKLAGGVEMITYFGGTRRTGLGFTAGHQVGNYTLTGNLGSGKNLLGQSARSLGLTLNSQTGWTLGAINDAAQTSAGRRSANTVYGAYTVPLFDIQRATLTTALSGSTAGGTNTTALDKGLKLRLNYVF